MSRRRPSLSPEPARFRLTFDYRFEAAHRFTQSCAESCATPHGHTWYAQAIFEAREDLARHPGDADMVLEFSRLKGQWKRFIQDTVDHSFLHHHQDPILGALKEHIPLFRGLPFPGDPTTELIAALFFAKLETMHAELAGASHVKPIGVRIRETPTNAITFRAGATSSRLIAALDARYKGWWRSSDPSARDLSERLPARDAAPGSSPKRGRASPSRRTRAAVRSGR